MDGSEGRVGRPQPPATARLDWRTALVSLTLLLEVIGDVGAFPAYTKELQAMASPAVRFSGSIPEAEKTRHLSSFDVLVVPSLGLERFGLAARALGVPVLASRRVALTEAFADGVCGTYFEPGDAAGLRAWVDRLSGRPEMVGEWVRRLPALKTMDALW
jgi:glycosyltransferase involved in cell wall biosynthesis